MRLKFVFIVVLMSILFINTNSSSPLHAQCSTQLYSIFWDGANHVVTGCISGPANYGFTFSGPIGYTAYQNFTGSGNFTLPFGGLGALPAFTTLGVRISSPVSTNTVTCNTNSQGRCAPEPDDDGDGVPNYLDTCPTQGNQGYGLAPNGCPLPAPTAVPPPTATPVSIVPIPPTAVPPQPGQPNPPPPVEAPTNPPPPPTMTPTPVTQVFTPGICEVAFLYPTIYLRSGPGNTFDSVLTKGMSDRPLAVIGSTLGTDGFIWYQIPGGVPLYVRSDVVELGRPCPIVSEQPIETAIQTEVTPPTEAGSSEPPHQSANRSIPPLEHLAQLGCPVQPGEIIREEDLVLIVEAPNPCQAKIEVAYPRVLASSVENVKNYFDNNLETEQLFEKMLTCSTPILEWATHLTMSRDISKTIESLIGQLIGDADVCALLEQWRTTPDTPIPLPPEIPVGDGINIGIMICSHPEMTQARYNQLWNYLRHTWQIPIENMVCDEINSANRIGTPTQDQLDLLAKLRQCPDLIPRPINLLEKFIIQDNVKPEWLTVSCEDLIIASECADCAPIELPAELETCILNNEDRALMTLFIKNHAELLNSSDLANLYTAINPCHAVVTYLNTGIITPPIIIPTPIPTEITPEVPILTPTTQATTTQATPAPDEPIAQEILLELGFDKPTGNNTQLKIIGVIFVRDNTLIIQENNTQKVIDADVEGEKYAPILFTINNRRVVAYIIVHDGQARIRMINLSSGDATYAKLPDIITPYHQSPLAYGGSMLVFTGIDPNGTYNLYGIPFSNSAQASVAVPLINNAMNATAVEGLSGFVFEQPNAENNILLWIPGRQDFRILDNNMNGECRSPVGERFGGKWRFWFLCDSEWGQSILHVNDMQSGKPLPFDIGSYLRQQRANTITQLNLGELQGELFLSDGDSIFLYHQREAQPKVERFMRGAIAIFTFSRE